MENVQDRIRAERCLLACQQSFKGWNSTDSQRNQIALLTTVKFQFQDFPLIFKLAAQSRLYLI